MRVWKKCFCGRLRRGWDDSRQKEMGKRQKGRGGGCMYPLVMLYRLQGRALGRRMTRNMRSAKGFLLSGFLVLVLAVWLAPSLWQAHRLPRTDPAQVGGVAPVVML